MISLVPSTHTEDILGYPIAAADVRACVECAMGWIGASGRARVIVCANPHSLVMARGDRAFREALLASDLLLPDGAGILIASKVLGGTIRRRVTGSDIFRELNAALDRRGGLSIFLLGTTEATLVAMERRMRQDFPRLRVAGRHAPPFKDAFSPDDDDEMVAAVNQAKPDVLWVGMSAPKQERWIHRNRGRLEVAVIGAVGAVFDFYTGRVKRSHPIFQRMGLEWLPRLVREPRRLLRRNLHSPVFLKDVLMWKRAGCP